MKVYLDMCALKRVYDDRNQARIDAEALAVLRVLDRVALGLESLVWSAALTLENNADPDTDAVRSVSAIKRLASETARLSPSVRSRAEAWRKAGLSPLDSIHAALAESAACDVLLTCDDRFIRRASRMASSLRVLNPIQFQKERRDGESTQ